MYILNACDRSSSLIDKVWIIQRYFDCWIFNHSVFHEYFQVTNFSCI